jgi:hypothetical protein
VDLIKAAVQKTVASANVKCRSAKCWLIGMLVGGKRERTRYARSAKATFRKDRRLNIRLSSKDLEAIQKRALAEGWPYQTLIASLLHKYASGRLTEI